MKKKAKQLEHSTEKIRCKKQTRKPLKSGAVTKAKNLDRESVVNKVTRRKAKVGEAKETGNLKNGVKEGQRGKFMQFFSWKCIEADIIDVFFVGFLLYE